MPGGVYLIQDNGQLFEMTAHTPPTEDQLQTLLANYPNLLAGDQINSSVPRRWLLISREVPLSSEPDSASRWSVDHLFLDQDAIPTIVEVKRAADTRIRREVVGQILEYAANAVSYWSIDTLRTLFEANCQSRGLDPAQELSAFLAGDAPEAFWSQAKTNLQRGKVRLMIVADIIPSELRRIVEYLNQQLRDAEVLALEIRQYAANTQSPRVLVPLVMGQTVERQTTKATATSLRGQWDEVKFFADLVRQRGPTEEETVRHIYEWAKVNTTIKWGTGGQTGSFIPTVTSAVGSHSIIAVYSDGRVAIQFTQLKSPPFDQEAGRRELLHRLNRIQGVSLPDRAIFEWPQFRVQVLNAPIAIQLFLDTLTWVIDQIESV